jgi:hypothetical protein
VSLASQRWESASIHDVAVEILVADQRKLDQFPEPLRQKALSRDTSRPADNHFRLRLLHHICGQVVCEIPPDTAWFAVRSLSRRELDEVTVIAPWGWHVDGDHRLLAVAPVRGAAMESCPSSWRMPVLWGHSRDGPFTIIDGHHRLTSYARYAGASTPSIPVLVGLSETPCWLHAMDHPVWPVANHLLKSGRDGEPWPDFVI